MEKEGITVWCFGSGITSVIGGAVLIAFGGNFIFILMGLCGLVGGSFSIAFGIVYCVDALKTHRYVFEDRNFDS